MNRSEVLDRLRNYTMACVDAGIYAAIFARQPDLEAATNCVLSAKKTREALDDLADAFGDTLSTEESLRARGALP